MKQIYHPWFNWECFKAGFYDTEEKTENDRIAYRDFLSDDARFGAAIERVFREWPTSCEHFLSNPAINRIAWLGQASMCIATGVPSIFKGGFRLLTEEQQGAANEVARKKLEAWLSAKENSQVC